MKLEESPVFREMKEAGEGSKAPLTEAFGRWPNLKIVLIALVGAVAGQAVVWYTGQFYALFFLEKTLKVDGATANILIAIALAVGNALLHPVRLAVGQDRSEADHPGRLRACRADLFPAVRGADRRGQSGAGASAGERAGDCRSPIPPIARSSSIRSGATTFDKRSCDVAKSYLAKARSPMTMWRLQRERLPKFASVAH